MPRLTVDFGIDLGTTNSVVAVRDGEKISVIPNREGAVTTPSAVHIDRRGRIHVGAAAKARAFDEPENTAVVFKRTMGQGAEAAKRFTGSGRSMLPEELSAEILKQLRGDIRDKRGEEPRGIVVTIPADFDAGQSAATREAARLAGFAECTLLQEPIAAAVAYGFDKLDESAYWLVYDFGGGTFDAAVVHLEDGLPTVVNHVGNNHLGGSDIDRDLVSLKLVPALTRAHDLPAFDPASAFWRKPHARFVQEAERAKIEVCRTRRPFLIVVDGLCEDHKGRPVDFEHELTPEDMAEVTRPYVAQTLALCRKALEEKGMRPAQIDRVIMVGGSTLNPWVRDGVQAELNRPLEIKIDPMTVVAEGAAVFASTLKYPPGDDEVPPGSYRLDVVSGLTIDESPAELIAKILPPQGWSVEGLTIELVDEARGWRSGRIPIRDGGHLRTTLRVAEGRTTALRVELRAVDGTLLACAPETITFYWGTAGDIEIPLTQNIGVGMADGSLDAILVRGTPLPAKGRRVHQTVRRLERDARSEPLRIPLYQGPNKQRAVRNRLLMAILVRGDQVARDMPAGTEVEIELSCDRSNKLEALVFFPQFELEVPGTVELDKSMPSVPTLEESLRAEESRLAELRKKAAGTPGPHADKALHEVDGQDFPRRIRQLLREPDNMDARGNAERLVRDFATAIDLVEDTLDWPVRVKEAEEYLAVCREDVVRLGKGEHRRRLETIERDLTAAIASRSVSGVEARLAELIALRRELVDNDPRYQASGFYALREKRGEMTDQRAADALIRQGEAAMERGDLESLKSANRQLIGLLPTIEIEGDPDPKGHTQGKF